MDTPGQRDEMRHLAILVKLGEAAAARTPVKTLAPNPAALAAAEALWRDGLIEGERELSGYAVAAAGRAALAAEAARLPLPAIELAALAALAAAAEPLPAAQVVRGPGAASRRQEVLEQLTGRGLVTAAAAPAAAKGRKTAARFAITPAGRSYVEMAATPGSVAAADRPLLDWLAQQSGPVALKALPRKGPAAKDRAEALDRLAGQGLIERDTRLRIKGGVLWLTERGRACLDDLAARLEALRHGQAAPQAGAEPPPEKPDDDGVLATIAALDHALGTANYLPLFHLRAKLQPPLSRDELDQALRRLERRGSLTLSTLQEGRQFSPAELAAGIPQVVGGPLFYIVLN